MFWILTRFETENASPIAAAPTQTAEGFTMEKGKTAEVFHIENDTDASRIPDTDSDCSSYSKTGEREQFRKEAEKIKWSPAEDVGQGVDGLGCCSSIFESANNERQRRARDLLRPLATAVDKIVQQQVLPKVKHKKPSLWTDSDFETFSSTSLPDELLQAFQEVGIASPDLEVAEGQPLRLKLLSQLAELTEEPDRGFLQELQSGIEDGAGTISTAGAELWPRKHPRKVGKSIENLQFSKATLWENNYQSAENPGHLEADLHKEMADQMEKGYHNK